MGKVYPYVQDDAYANIETGEIKKFRTYTKPIYGGRQFWKFYMENVVPVLKLIGNKPVQIFAYILENMDERDNRFSRTYKEISKDVDVNESTIAITMKKLQKCGFIALEKGGEWIVHPDMLYKGEDNRRHKIIRLFDDCEKNDGDKRNYKW